jgi:hypothetical protein
MADIKIQDLSTHNISGMNLFNDSENFMIELNEEDECEHIIGGALPKCYSWINEGTRRIEASNFSRCW